MNAQTIELKAKKWPLGFQQEQGRVIHKINCRSKKQIVSQNPRLANCLP
jgi:hypothetical protein